MAKPILFTIDDDPQVASAIQSDLRKQYRKEYRIMSTTSAHEALETLKELKARGDNVALLLSDQRMPEMLGVDFLEQAQVYFPQAKRVLLTAYSDIEAAIKAINEVQLDYYLTKPWDPPHEKLYPIIDDLLADWQANSVQSSGLRVIGYPFSPQSHKIKDFLAGNMIPYQWLDIHEEETQTLLSIHDAQEAPMPMVMFPDGSYESNPTIPQVAAKVGMTGTASADMYDVAIIGAGPAGLAAAVYGGSEGLKTLLVEKRAPGGQAGTSSRIENYLGFPKGLSGSDLARRAITQATRFGVEFLAPQEVKEIELSGPYKILHLEDGSKVNTRSVVVTTGVDYRRHPAPGVEQFSGAGIYYGAASTEASSCKSQPVFVVGGGNSAGQAAVYLSRFAAKVSIVIRRQDLSSTMSQYLIDQIADIENIELVPRTEIIEAKGDERLTDLVLRNMDTEAVRNETAGALFIFIGARPYTEWLGDLVIRDQKGFVETGFKLKQKSDFGHRWHDSREPLMLETSQPGIFAAGDVRSGAMNRVASAVGEGAMAIKFVHEYLAMS
ncbi:FAD-dependent oxidoreductase [Pontibacter sp. G13]|uniref:FAD-dependent oxidoreductase n=1 Tax=Pontibacter sp. G13 TaxID=3074898 RepID=UPI00288BA2B6|nr:FAD-dependent oxidoreductase [Pontibacter sp. G13]WNJ18742.1 FAD-dependent oxidoreductase [Pontibacter sp. G13]